MVCLTVPMVTLLSGGQIEGGVGILQEITAAWTRVGVAELVKCLEFCILWVEPKRFAGV